MSIKVTEPTLSALSPKTEFSSGPLRLESSSAGFALFWNNTLVFKSWPDFFSDPPTDALLFLRDGKLVLRNAFGEISSPEASLTQDERALLAKIFSARLPTKETT